MLAFIFIHFLEPENTMTLLRQPPEATGIVPWWVEGSQKNSCSSPKWMQASQPLLGLRCPKISVIAHVQ